MPDAQGHAIEAAAIGFAAVAPSLSARSILAAVIESRVKLDADSSRTAAGRVRSWQVLALVAVLLALRLPILSHPVPVHPDETAFIDGFGFPRVYPVHPPGYAGWVGLGTVLYSIGLSPYAAYQGWCVVASIAGPVVFLLLAARRLPVALAWWTALALGVTPAVWFWGVTAMTYVPAMCFAVCAAWACMGEGGATARRERLRIGLASMLVGMTIRLDLLVYVGPMLLFAAWRNSRAAAARTAVSMAVGAAALAGGIALLYSRDPASDMAARFAHSREVFFGTSVFVAGLADGLARNAVKIVANAGWALGLAAPVVAWAAVALWRRREREPGTAMLALWIVPGLAFQLLTHVAQGYLLPLVPGVLLLAAMGLHAACSARRAQTIMTAIAVCSAAQFVFYPWSAESGGVKRSIDAKVAFQSARGLLNIDQRGRIHRDGDLWRMQAHDRLPAASQPAASD